MTRGWFANGGPASGLGWLAIGNWRRDGQANKQRETRWTDGRGWVGRPASVSSSVGGRSRSGGGAMRISAVLVLVLVLAKVQSID